MIKKISKAWIYVLAGGLAVVLLTGNAERSFRMKDAPLLFNDFAALKYQCEAAREFHAASGAIWGYDPHFMAGFPLGFVWNSNIALQRLAVLFPDASVDSVLKAFISIGLLLFAPVWWVSLRNFGLTRSETAFGMALGGAYFMAGMPMLFFLGGMPTAGAGTCLSVLAASFVFRFGKEGRAAAWAAAVATCALALFVHKTSAVALAPAFLAAAAWALLRRRFLRAVLVAAIPAAMLLANIQWLAVMFRFMPDMESVPEARFWMNLDLLRPFKDYFTASVTMNNHEFGGAFGAAHAATLWLLLVAGAAGALALWRRGARGSAAFLAAFAAFFWLYSYYGAFLPGGQTLNPSRYFPLSQFALAAAGGAGIGAWAESRKHRATGRAAALIISIVCAALMVVGSARAHFFYDNLLRQPAPPDALQLVEVLKQLPPGARVMLEDSGSMDEESEGQIFGKSQLPALFGLWTGREFIGGPYPYVFLKHRRAGFYDARAFGSRLSDSRPDELLNRLKLYNVKWIVCWSGSAKEYFSKFSGYYTLIDRAGRFDIFEVSGFEPSYFIRGGGDVYAGYGRIDVRNARAENGELILKYHWMSPHRTTPAIDISRFETPDDPVGFIRITDPPENFSILLP